jgi:hypothetical protein
LKYYLLVKDVFDTAQQWAVEGWVYHLGHAYLLFNSESESTVYGVCKYFITVPEDLFLLLNTNWCCIYIYGVVTQQYGS